MASREKRPLAPSKSKQKVNNDCTLPTIDQKNRKGKGQTRQHQIAQDILEAVATGSQVPVKINTGLPRKTAIKNIRRKAKLKTTKSNLIKVKITKKAPIRSLRKTNAETIRGVRGRRTKKSQEEAKNIEIEIESPESNNSTGKIAAKGNSNSVKSLNTALNTFKNSLKQRKLNKYPIRSTEADNCITEIPEKETDATNSTAINSRISPKAGRKVKITYKKAQNLDNEDTQDNTSAEAESKLNKVCRGGVIKRLVKEKDNSTKALEDTASSSKNFRLKRNTSKEREIQNNTRIANLADTKSIKAIFDNKNLVDLTIDEVIACTVVESETEESQGLGKKSKRGRKASERLLSESEIKKEADLDDSKTSLNESSIESDSEILKVSQISKDMSQNSPDCLKSVFPRTRYNRTSAQRSLRNGKLRGASEFGVSADSESNEQYKLESEDQTGSDTCPGDSSIEIIEGEQFLYDSNLDSSQGNMASTKGENQSSINDRTSSKSFEEDESNGTEAGNNNNNGERGDRASEVGPMLRSKTKAKTTDTTATSLDGKSSVDVKVDDVKTELKRSGSTELPRKENILVNILEKPKSRRSSLNVEIKKTVGSFYGSDKSDNSKSQIDQMIENIKLNIAKSIESKIFGPEKSLVLNKNFEMSKTEEIIAPLSAELQKKNLEENDEDVNSPNISKNEIKSENSENSVPKVADTAKEIEKMVMGDMKIVDTQSQERQKNCTDNSNVATTSDLIKVFKYSDAATSESLCEAHPTSDEEELKAGTIMDILENLEKGRQTAMSTENTSIASSKSTECNENQSPKVQSLIEIRQSSVKTRNVLGGDGSESSNKDGSDCALNYQVFEQELRDDHKALTSDMKSNSVETESVARSDNVNTAKKSINNDENDSSLKTTIQSDESETLESISREVERLVAESDSDNSKITKSMHQPPNEVVQNIENRSPIGDLDKDKNKKSGSENVVKNKNYGDLMDIVDAEVETSKFLDTLESSFTDSDILNMAPEITEVLAAEESSPSETLDSKKFTQEPSDDIKSGEIDETVFTIQEKVSDHQSILNGQDVIVGSKNLPSRSDTHISRLKETMELENLNVEQKSKSKEQAEMNRDGSMGQENLVKNPEIFDEFNRSIENDRSPTVTGETSSEKQTKNRERTLHASIKTTNIDASNGEGTMKKDSRLENFDKPTITADEQTCLNEENKRVLRARDRQKKVESGRKSRETVHSSEMIDKMKLIVNISEHVKNTEDAGKAEIADKELSLQGTDSGQELTSNKQNVVEQLSNTDEVEKTEALKQETAERGVASGPLIRTRRSREMKKRKDDQQQMHNVQKSKRSKRDNRKLDQQNKEETLLDNEVAKINENTESLSEKYEKSYKADGNFRGFSEGSSSSKTIFGSGKVRKNDNDRSHSETDLEMVKLEMEDVELAKKRLGNASTITDVIENPSRNSETNSENDKKILEHGLKIPEALQKDLDETSTSSESSSSAVITSKILETPEDKLKKESILRILGLESLEKAAERMNHQKAKKEQYTGTLKTVIRVQKEKDKKRSRSPLKMVLKQGRSDGDGDSPEFYTIQKELGTSGLGDSSSGANRKFSTNHRHSCDEDPEEPPSKDRQSLVIPEKSSSFSIHPGRLCADVCCYCFGKFGSLDTPMHLAQMKSDERRKKILNVERHLTKDSCLCDACYRHVDRKANTSPTNMQNKPQRQHRQLMVSKCSARECREPARHHVKRRWLLKIKAGLHNQVDIDWESSQHTSMSFCVHHYSKIERFLTCALCKRRLARNHTHQLVAVETDELNDRLGQQGIPVPLSAGTFVCKLCRYFTQLQLKYKDVENMNTNHKSFFKSYRKQILHYHDIEVLENEEEDSSSQGQPAKDKEKRKKSKFGQGKSGSTKSVESAQNSTSEKSTPEPSKSEGINFETENDTFANQNNTTSEKDREQQDSEACRDIQILNVEDSVENIKKRKSHDMQSYNNSAAVSCGSANDLVEILALDKEVTLTRLPKKARTNNDITPVVQRLGANPSISVRTLFPGEEEMNLHANVEFNNVREVTPQGWEKCATMIQYDRDTKLLWQELQRPYGNQSSFLRHLILLEKYYRSGDLVLAPNASRNAINYSTSVQNRLISYEGPEKVDEPILEPIASEFANPRRLSGGFMMERDRFSMPSTSSFLTNTTINSNPTNTISNSSKTSPPRILKLNSGVSIIKKPPPNLHRLNLPSTSTSSMISTSKNKEIRMPVMSGGKVFQLSEPEYKKLQTLKRQKQMLNEKQVSSANLPTNNSGSVSPSSPHNSRPATQYQKAQLAAHTQFQKHLRIQQEMLSRQSRSDFEPLICDVRTLANENNPTQNLLSNLNLPKSIQVTTKPTNTIPIMPKIPRSLTVIPQTITKPTEK